MSGNGDSKRIERMFKDKQDRIDRQIALQVAGQIVTVNPASAVKDPEVITSKVLRVAEIYYNWICNGGRK
jgi:hypothetical protein